eukprot:tig00000106_g5286.t1
MSDALFVSERKFRVQSQDLQRLVDTANAPIFCVDTQLRVTDWNRAAARVTGLEPNAVLARAFWGWSPNETGTARNASWSRSNCVGLGPPRAAEASVLLGAVAADAAGAVNVVGAVAVGQDLTEKRARIEMEATKNRFLAYTVHELRTPLNGVLGMGELLSDTDLTEHQLEIVHMMRVSADQMLVIVNE